MNTNVLICLPLDAFIDIGITTPGKNFLVVTLFESRSNSRGDKNSESDFPFIAGILYPSKERRGIFADKTTKSGPVKRTGTGVAVNTAKDLIPDLFWKRLLDLNQQIAFILLGSHIQQFSSGNKITQK